MKKKVFVLILVGIMVLSVGACGKNENNSETKEEKKEPPDLSGTWKSEENNDSYQEAIISNDTIEINWVSDGGQTKSIYWIGTYTAPSEALDDYNWTSERNKEKTDFAILASTDDTKEFTYKDDKISYEVSAMGTTTILELTKQ